MVDRNYLLNIQNLNSTLSFYQFKKNKHLKTSNILKIKRFSVLPSPLKTKSLFWQIPVSNSSMWRYARSSDNGKKTQREEKTGLWLREQWHSQVRATVRYLRSLNLLMDKKLGHLSSQKKNKRGQEALGGRWIYSKQVSVDTGLNRWGAWLGKIW